MACSSRASLLPVAVSILALSGCVSTSFHPAPGFEARQGPSVSPDSVLFLPSAPNRPYVTLGEIEAWLSGFPSNETAERRTREAAAAVGADAVIKRTGNLFADEPGSNGETVSPRTVSFTVTAIRYVDPAQP
ncbi:MAG: hypothetical protein U0529_18470 [Thermoanaerobaculia bacterium]